MKKLFIALVLVLCILTSVCGCSDKPDNNSTSSYVDIDKFEDDGENIIPSTPNASVTIPSDWVN